MMNALVIFDFNRSSDIQNWRIVDDVVMGGKSSGQFSLNSEGYGVFEGKVSLENNGGFSSVRYHFDRLSVKNHTTIRLRLKGDGKAYQFRIKTNTDDYYSYIKSFSTTGEWETIDIPLAELYPSFRGRRLEMPNFSDTYFESLSFLIANKKQETFILLIDKIELV